MRTISKMMPMLLVVLAAVGCKPEDEARLVAASDDGRLQSEARETVPVATAGGGDVQDGPGEAGPAAARDIGKFQDGLRQAGIWAGGPGFKFEGVGRETLAAAIKYGLDPDHKVLDVGAGSLRVGWWLLHYVEPENYHAIEPVKNRVDTAAAMIGADIHVYYNTDWEFPPVDFDFVIARSIWTHASKWMISKMLAEFADNSAPNARFLASVLPARHPWEDYQGDEWVGRVEKSDTPGMIRHRPRWMRRECEKYGLTFEVKEELYGQTWVLVTRPASGSVPPGRLE